MDVTRLHRFMDQPTYQTISNTKPAGTSTQMLQRSAPLTVRHGPTFAEIRQAEIEALPRGFDEVQRRGELATERRKNQGGTANTFGRGKHKIRRERLGHPPDDDLLDTNVNESLVGIEYDTFQGTSVKRAELTPIKFPSETAHMSKDEIDAIRLARQTVKDCGFLVFDEQTNDYKSKLTGQNPNSEEHLIGNGPIKQRIPGLITPKLRRQLHEQEIAAQNAAREQRKLLRSRARWSNTIARRYPDGILGPAAEEDHDEHGDDLDGESVATEYRDSISRQRHTEHIRRKHELARSQHIAKWTNSILRRGYDILSGQASDPIANSMAESKTNSKSDELRLLGPAKRHMESWISKEDLNVGKDTFTRCFNQPVVYRENPNRKQHLIQASTRGREYDIITQCKLPTTLQTTSIQNK